MQNLNRIFSIFKSVSLLAVVLMLAFTVPMSANTSMADHGSIDEHHEMNLDHSDYTHDVSAMNMTPSDNINRAHEHNGAVCCETGMCISAAILESFNISEAEQTHNHISLPISKMTSAGKSRLIRPPSL